MRKSKLTAGPFDVEETVQRLETFNESSAQRKETYTLLPMFAVEAEKNLTVLIVLES